MKQEQYIVLGLAGVAVVVAAYVGGLHTPKRVEITRETIKIGMTKPVLWVYYNDSDVNARQWSDFGARSSRALNLPAINLFYETIVTQNGVPISSCRRYRFPMFPLSSKTTPGISFLSILKHANSLTCKITLPHVSH